MPQIKFRVFRQRQGGTYKWFGRIDLPIGVQPQTAMLPLAQQKPVVTLPVTAPGTSKESALANAANLASKIASNPFMQAVMPPGTGAALKATQLAAKYGPGVMKKITGEGAKRVGNFFKSLF